MAITINGSGTVTGLAVGGLPDGTVDAGTLATDSVTAVKIPDTVESSLKSGRKNLIINGGMTVAQRGTSITVSNSNWLYLMDRFQFDENGSTSAILDVTQSTDAPEGFGYSLKMTATTADAALASADGLRLQHRIEAKDLQSLAHGTSTAKPVTLSFWVKSKTTGTNGIWVYKNDSSRQTSFSYTINAADTWEYKTITIPADTSSTINNDNGEGLRVSWYLAAGTDFNSGTLASSWESTTSANRAVGQVNNFAATSDYWAITGVQLELGSVATDFEHRSYGEELALCQRYYQKHISGDLYTGFGYTHKDRIYGYRYIKPMRIPPTLSYSALGHFSIRNVNNTVIGTPTAITHSRPGSQFTNLQFTHASIVSTSAYHIVANGTSNAWIAFDAEL